MDVPLWERCQSNNVLGRRVVPGRRGRRRRLAYCSRQADVVELVDTQDLGSCVLGRAGSSPVIGTQEPSDPVLEIQIVYHRHMTMTVPEVDDSATASLTAAACLFHGFGDRSRLVILQHLLLGDHRVVELTDHLGLAQSTVSQHLACLKDCGLVSSRPEGRASVFAVTHPEATTALLAAAEQLLDLTGFAVTLCPDHGVATRA
jgi:DNA-binding transcriptional ArsR family regulator